MIIKNGRIINPSDGFDQIGDMLIEDGRIKDIGKFEEVEDRQIIDGEGCVVAPDRKSVV